MKFNSFLSLMLLLSVLSYYGCNTSDGNGSEQEESVPVEVNRVSLGNVVQSLEYNGDIKAAYQVNVFSRVSDRIETFYVEEGDAVKKGQPIADIVATTIKQNVRQAESALVAANAQEANLNVEFQRAQRLIKEEAMSQQQYDAIKTQYDAVKAQTEQAEAALISAKSRLSDARITAPISGIIGKKYYEAGDMAPVSAPLVSIVQMDQVKIEFNATEEDLGKLAVGQDTKVQVKAFPDQKFYGKVYRISPVLDPTTRMAEIEVLVDNPGHKLKPGMYAEVEVITGIMKDVIVVPRFAAIENTSMRKIDGEDQVVKNYFVFVVDSNRAMQKKLKLSYVNHRWLAVDSGIQIGDQLVVAGQNNLRDSMLVSIAKEEGNNE